MLASASIVSMCPAASSIDIGTSKILGFVPIRRKP
jgi:hypothetical protein